MPAGFNGPSIPICLTTRTQGNKPASAYKCSTSDISLIQMVRLLLNWNFQNGCHRYHLFCSPPRPKQTREQRGREGDSEMFSWEQYLELSDSAQRKTPDSTLRFCSRNGLCRRARGPALTPRAQKGCWEPDMHSAVTEMDFWATCGGRRPRGTQA